MTRLRPLILAAGTLLATAAAAQDRAVSPAQDRAADRRAADTERRMTDDERFRLLHGILAVDVPGLATKPAAVTPAAGYIEGVPRLGIPDIYESDASLGVANPFGARKNDVATAMPSGLSLAATFAPDLAFAGGVLIGSENRAKGFQVLLAGGVNLARDPRNGRNFEYLGEDPLLAGTLAGASIRGIQSQHVVSTIKHFALNDQETLRNTLDARIAEPASRESDLLAFQLAIEEGRPGAVMCGYNLVAGTYACENDWLLNGVLKRDWRYPGWVMSDWGAVHGVGAFAAGLDQQSGSQLDARVFFDAPLRAEVTAGRVSAARVSDAVRRILRSLYAVGADMPYAGGPADLAAHAATARAAGAAGIVLLKNDGGVLPLLAASTRVAVIGGHADIGVLSGGGSSQVIPAGANAIVHVGGRGIAGHWARAIYFPSAPLAAIAAALPKAKVEFDSGYVPEEAAAFAARADVAVVFATAWSSEGVDSSLDLPEGQDRLIAAVAAANPRTVVVLETGNPVKMPWLSKVAAVVEAWYPGQEGGAAIADVLTGAVEPSGRLPISFPANEAQLPRPAIPGLGAPEGMPASVTYDEGADIGYRRYAAKGLAPLFPFGFGLGYTSFAHGPLTVRGGARPTVSVTVTNSGARAGIDVAQIYLTATPAGPSRRLVGFERVALKPGERRTVRIAIDPRLMGEWRSGGWTVPAGHYAFASGTSSLALDAGGGILMLTTPLRWTRQ